MSRVRILAVAVVALFLSACGTSPVPKPEPIVTAAEGVAGIVAHTQSAERHVQSAVPHADSEGKVHLSAASDEHSAILTGASQTRTALAATQQQVADLRQSIADGQVAYQKLEDRWYVVWGRRIEKALWIIGILWLVLGIASIWLGLGNPLSWGYRIGQEIAHLSPAMNPFVWIRNWIAGAKQG